MEPTDDLLRGLLAAAPDAILGVRSGRIEFLNEQAERLYGYPADELIGSRADALVAGGEFDAQISQRAQVKTDPSSRPTGAMLELTALRKDGTSFPADVGLSLVSDNAGATLVLCAVRDASDRIELEAARRRQALEEERDRSHRLESLGQLAGGVAHDFNNLLGVILNYTSLLRRQVSEPTAVGDLDEIRAAAERAASLTRQLLTFARRDVMDPERLDVNSVVRGTADMLRRTLGAHVELRLELLDQPVIATFDRHQLDQIILNLGINARDAMPERGILTIATRASAAPSGVSQVVLTVADNGQGMEPWVAERAFEPFFSTKPKGEGTGLGLSTVYGMVQQNGGDVTIESVVGRGTTITVVLPGSAGITPIAAVSASTSGDTSERILLVEDEAALREGTARLLQARGYGVLTAADGVEALDIMDREEQPIDLVVTDVAMPRMRGDELARRLGERDPRLPVIFMSGYDSGEAPQPGLLLPKPVAEHDLLRAVREVLDG